MEFLYDKEPRTIPFSHTRQNEEHPNVNAEY